MMQATILIQQGSQIENWPCDTSRATIWVSSVMGKEKCEKGWVSCASLIVHGDVALSSSSGRQKTCSHQNDIVWTLFDPLSTTFIHF
jgi:hypothetical protein